VNGPSNRNAVIEGNSLLLSDACFWFLSISHVRNWKVTRCCRHMAVFASILFRNCERDEFGFFDDCLPIYCAPMIWISGFSVSALSSRSLSLKL
jgi:hypothetical protein